MDFYERHRKAKRANGDRQNPKQKVIAGQNQFAKEDIDNYSAKEQVEKLGESKRTNNSILHVNILRNLKLHQSTNTLPPSAAVLMFSPP